VPILLDQVAEGAVAANLAEVSLAGALASNATMERRASTVPAKEVANGRSVLGALRSAENRFLYLWEGCSAEVVSVKRASLLGLLLSLGMVTLGAPKVYIEFANESHLAGPGALFSTLDQLLTTLGLGLLLCACIYSGASFLEHTLSDRRAQWKYFHSELESRLSG